MNGIPSDLRPSALDHGLGAFRALASLLPAGGIAAELFCSIIPNQRMDRVVAYLEELQRRLSTIEDAPTLAEAEHLSSAKAELFEAGVRSAARPMGAERMEHIARAVADGLSSDDLAAARHQRMLDLSDQVSADDLIVLCSHVTPFAKDRDWQEAHQAVLFTDDYLQGLIARRAGRNVIQEARVATEIQRQRLISLGLLTRATVMQARPNAYARNPAAPPLISAGQESVTITAAGVSLLRFLGLQKHEPVPEASHPKEWDALEDEEDRDA